MPQQKDSVADTFVIGSAYGSRVRLEGCEFPDNSEEHQLLNISPEEYSDVFFSDVSRTVTNLHHPASKTKPLDLAGGQFLSLDDASFVYLQKVIDSPERRSLIRKK